jgi:hypothetical protein
LNAEPSDGALLYLLSGCIDETHPDWAHGLDRFSFEKAKDCFNGGGGGGEEAAQAEAAEAAAAPSPTLRLEVQANGMGAASCVTGARLSHPFAPLANGCGSPVWTNYVRGFQATLDYVLSGMRGVGAMPPPPLEAVTAQTALPNAEFGSDHLIQCCDLEA